jgi:hypothetical protein
MELNPLVFKTIEAYSRAIRRIATYFNGHLDNLSQDQLLDYFHDLLGRLSWSAVKLDLYGLKFFYTHVTVEYEVAGLKVSGVLLLERALFL